VLPWNNSDKAASLYLMMQLGSKMTPEEIFQCLTHIANIISDRFDIRTEPLPTVIPSELADGLRHCLEEHAA
jgi:hypothetical protein